MWGEVTRRAVQKPKTNTRKKPAIFTNKNLRDSN